MSNGIKEPITKEKRKRGENGSLPDVNVRDLVEERNWSALAGLALIAVGVLYLVQDILGFDLNLWNLLMLGVGGWLMVQSWRAYQANGRVWIEPHRTRMIAGAAIGFVGLISAFHLAGWEWLLLAIAGALMYVARQEYIQNGRAWTPRSRSRMTGGVVIGLIGLFGLINLWSTWPLLLIVVGAAMLFGFIGGGRKGCC